MPCVMWSHNFMCRQNPLIHIKNTKFWKDFDSIVAIEYLPCPRFKKNALVTSMVVGAVCLTGLRNYEFIIKGQNKSPKMLL